MKVSGSTMLLALASLATAGGCSGGGGGGGGAASTAPASTAASPAPTTTTTGSTTPAASGQTAPGSTAPLSQVLSQFFQTPSGKAVAQPAGSVAAIPGTQPVATAAPQPSGSSSGSNNIGNNIAIAFASAIGQTIGNAIQNAIQNPKLVNLGQALFHDKILSGNRDISCSTCHNQVASSGDGLSLSIGTGGQGVGPSRIAGTGLMASRNAPALFGTGSSGYGGSNQSFFWDARVTFSPVVAPDPNMTANPPAAYVPIMNTLTTPMSVQAMFPVLDETEMRGAPGSNELANAPDNLTCWSRIMARLVGTGNGTVGGIQGYRNLFSAAYPGVAFDDLNFGHAAQAISAFVGNSFTGQNSPYDDYTNNGNTSALTASQVNGMNLFMGAAQCSNCHSGTEFSDFLPHGAAAPQLGPGRVDPNDDRGTALVTLNTSDNYKFRTPSLRNVAITGPWMHDGAYTTLRGAVLHMLSPGYGLANYDATQLGPQYAATVDADPARNAARAAAIDPMFGSMPQLTSSQVDDIVNFLNALTDPTASTAAAAAKPSSVPSGLPMD